MSEPYYISRGVAVSCTADIRTWRNFLAVREQIIGLNSNVGDLETTVYQHKAGVDDRLDELTTAANDCGHLFGEHQREVYNAQKRVYSRVLFLFCVLTCIVTCIGFGWVFYTEAVAAQARADYLKRLWPVHAFFMRDRVMTVSWAEYYHIKYLFKAWFS